MQLSELFLQFRSQSGEQLAKPAWHVMIVDDDGRLKMLSAAKAVERGLSLSDLLSVAAADLMLRVEKAESDCASMRALLESATAELYATRADRDAHELARGVAEAEALRVGKNLAAAESNAEELNTALAGLSATGRAELDNAAPGEAKRWWEFWKP